jgi:tetratricopeptide (TPR) repeat protein
LRPNSRDTNAEVIGLYEHALALDPRSVEAQTNLAAALVARVLDLMTDSPSIDLARANGLIGQALAASPRFARAHIIRGRVLHAQNRWEEAISEFETALTLNRNLVWALHYLAGSKLQAGWIDEVIPLEEKAIRLSPREHRIGHWYATIGTVHLLQSRVDESIVWFEKARNDIPAAPNILSRLASAYALRGEIERAVAELAEARTQVGGDLFSSIAKLNTGGWWGVPKIRALFEATYFAGLRRAGMPEGMTDAAG